MDLSLFLLEELNPQHCDREKTSNFGKGMDLISCYHLRVSSFSPLSQTISSNNSLCGISSQSSNLSFPFWPNPFPYIPQRSCFINAKKKNPQSETLVKPSIVEQIEDNDKDEVFLDEFDDDELLEDDDDFQDYFEEDAEPHVGDGGGGGGISLAGTSWDKEALAIAEEVCLSFEGDLAIYAFKTLSNFIIRVRIEKLSNKSGSPTMMDIEAFSTAYGARLDEAEVAGSIPVNISLEVSSPGVERLVRVPQDLDRYKDRNFSVKYVSDVDETGSPSEHEGVFRLVSFDLETKCCTWGLADIRINREKSGKGRPLNKKQREWRLSTPFDSLRLVRIYPQF